MHPFIVACNTNDLKWLKKMKRQGLSLSTLMEDGGFSMSLINEDVANFLCKWEVFSPQKLEELFVCAADLEHIWFVKALLKLGANVKWINLYFFVRWGRVAIVEVFLDYVEADKLVAYSHSHEMLDLLLPRVRNFRVFYLYENWAPLICRERVRNEIKTRAGVAILDKIPVELVRLLMTFI